MSNRQASALWSVNVLRECLLEAGDDIDAALDAAEYILATQSVPEHSACLAHDIYNKRAQSILNKSLQSIKGLTSDAKRDLDAVLKKNKSNQGEAILKFVEKYHKQLTDLLTAAQVASLLEGAREVASKVPALDEDAKKLGTTELPTFPALSTEDARGNLHKGKGPGGGQFISKEEMEQVRKNLSSKDTTIESIREAAGDEGNRGMHQRAVISQVESHITDYHARIVEEMVRNPTSRRYKVEDFAEVKGKYKPGEIVYVVDSENRPDYDNYAYYVKTAYDTKDKRPIKDRTRFVMGVVPGTDHISFLDMEIAVKSTSEIIQIEQGRAIAAARKNLKTARPIIQQIADRIVSPGTDFTEADPVEMGKIYREVANEIGKNYPDLKGGGEYDWDRGFHYYIMTLVDMALRRNVPLSINAAFADSPLLNIIEAAAKSLAEKNVITRAGYDALSASARAKAFTVAGVDAEATLVKIRDLLAENVRKGADYETFRKEVLAAVEQGTFMSDAHLETVFRANVQSAFSDGQMAVLSNPLVRSGFPYATYDSIHDDRVRDEHRSLDTRGIDGTNVYRSDDPVFQMFRPPWDWNCRCSWSPMTVRQAAAAGVGEAKEWLRTGLPPSDPARVAPPPFTPPEGWERAVAEIPLSVKLSMQSAATFAPIKFLPVDHVVMSIGEDEYPRDSSNRFLNKKDIVEAARDQDTYTRLRESIPESERWKLDRVVVTLQAGGTIHHPKENPGLAVNVDGLIVDPRWAEYDAARTARDEWVARNTARTECRICADKAVRHMRRQDGRIDRDRLDRLLREAGATDAEMRSLSRMRYRASLKDDDETLEKLDEMYEEVVEDVYQRIEKQRDEDPEPDKPEEPRDSPAFALGNWDESKISRRGKGKGGGQFVKKGTGGGGAGDGEKPGAGQHIEGDGGGVGRGGRADVGRTPGDGRAVAPSPGGPGVQGDGGLRPGTDQSAGDKTPGDTTTTIPATTTEPTATATGGDRPTPADTTTAREPTVLSDAKARAALNYVNRTIDRYTNAYRKTGQEQVAEWLEELRNHINEVGVAAAVDALSPEMGAGDPGTRVQYRGTDQWLEDAKFIKEYLDKTGVTVLQDGDEVDPDVPLIASAPVPDSVRAARAGSTRAGVSGDVLPQPGNIDTKLQESKLLPGLESTEDLDVIMGGNKVTHFTKDVVSALDQRYGEGKWIVKSYGDEAYAGFGVFFPERVRNIRNNARISLRDATKRLEHRGFSLYNDESGNVIGITDNTTGINHLFGTDEYRNIPSKIVRRLGRTARNATRNVRGTALPLSSEDSLLQNYNISIRWGDEADPSTGARKAVGITDQYNRDIDFGTPQWEEFKTGDLEYGGVVVDKIERAAAWGGVRGEVAYMAQPAFEAVGVTEAERAMGLTWETSTEGRVHVVVKDGKASVVPYATLARREDTMPVVFSSDDIRAMEKAAQDTIDMLPESERKGQVYAPDVMKTAEGWRVVELNASVESGSSLWLEANPLVIDAYVSHVTGGRDPSHVSFMRDLLRDSLKNLRGRRPSPADSTQPDRQGWTARPAVPLEGKPSTLAKRGVTMATEDEQGNLHKGKGPGGGQFVSKSAVIETDGAKYAKMVTHDPNVYYVPIDKMFEHGEAGRLTPTRLTDREKAELIESIEEIGYKKALRMVQEIWERGKDFVPTDPEVARTYLADGRHRLELAKLAGHTHVPVVLDRGGELIKVPSRFTPLDTSAALATEDEQGNLHKGKGPGGGQFTSKGSGGGKRGTGWVDKSKKEGIVARTVRRVKEFLFGKPSIPEKHNAAINAAMAKFWDLPEPTEEEVAEAQLGIEEYGIKLYRKNRRGNAPDRRVRRDKLLEEFGDGEVCPCVYCGVEIGEGTLEQDTIIPVSEGGRYTMPNLVPCCTDCHIRRGDMPFAEAIENATEHARTRTASRRDRGNRDDVP